MEKRSGHEQLNIWGKI